MGILGTTSEGRKKDRRKKPDELLSSVVRETAVPAAVDLLRRNEAFALPSGTSWVMLALEATSIGGLSKRHSSRDEAKGSIIGLIDSDQIRTVATADMLEEGQFGIIPDESTLGRMEEYSLLTGAEYSWAVVWQTPDGLLHIDAHTAGEATFADAMRISRGDMTLEKAISNDAWSEHSGVVEGPAGDVPQQDDGDEIFDGPQAGLDQGYGDGDGTTLPDETVLADDPYSDEAFQFPDDDGIEPFFGADADEQAGAAQDMLAGFDELDDPDAAYGSDTHPAQDDVVLLEDQAQARIAVARRFLADGLDLEIGFEEFEATFSVSEPCVQLELPTGSTEWLVDQVSQLTHQTNARLRQQRAAHDEELRALYVTLMSKHVDGVIRAVAIDREGSRYHLLTTSAEQAHRERLEAKDEKIRLRKAEIVRGYEEQAKMSAEQAAISAEVRFKERNRSRMERDQSDAVAEIERALEDERETERHDILRVRSNDARLKMQVGTSAIFEVLAEKQREFLASEQTQLDAAIADLQRFIDGHRLTDIARTNAMVEYNRTSNEVEDLRRQQEDQMAAVRREHDDRIRRLEDELDQSRREAITRTQTRDEEWRHSLELEKANTESASRRVSELLVQMRETEEETARRYEHQINEMRIDRERSIHELNIAASVQARSGKFLILMMIALSLLSLLAGYIGGAGLG